MECVRRENRLKHCLGRYQRPLESPFEENTMSLLLLLLGIPIFLLQFGLVWGAKPPFKNMMWLDAGIIRHTDPTSLQGIKYAGRGEREVSDRRFEERTVLDAYLFTLTFDDGVIMEAQVNPEFGSIQAAMAQAKGYGVAMGRLPRILRSGVEVIVIHDGDHYAGGNEWGVLIHTKRAEKAARKGFLEELLFHESAHAALDSMHKDEPGWLNAQKEDDNFISRYAHEYPDREDLAESFLAYLAVRYRQDRVSWFYPKKVTKAIPRRLAYFDAQGFASELHPMVTPEPPETAPKSLAPEENTQEDLGDRVARLEERVNALFDALEALVGAGKKRGAEPSGEHSGSKQRPEKIPTAAVVPAKIKKPVGVDSYYTLSGSKSVTNPIPLVQTTPSYTKAAINARAEGELWLQAIIRKTGKVDSFKVISWPKPGEKKEDYGLVESAIQEISENWRFKPGMLKGKPVDVLATIEVQFNLRDNRDSTKDQDQQLQHLEQIHLRRLRTN